MVLGLFFSVNSFASDWKIKNKWKENKSAFINDISISYGKLNKVIGSPVFFKVDFFFNINSALRKK